MITTYFTNDVLSYFSPTRTCTTQETINGEVKITRGIPSLQWSGIVSLVASVALECFANALSVNQPFALTGRIVCSSILHISGYLLFGAILYSLIREWCQVPSL